MKKTILAITLLLAGLSTNANAKFVTGDYLSENDSSITLDTTTGLEWLNLSLTNNKPINEVSGLIDLGEYEGFRLATEYEVAFMFEQFLTEDKDTWLSSDTKSHYMELFYKDEDSYAYGFVKGLDGAVSMYGGRSLDLKVYHDHILSRYDENYSSSYYGVYLVSNSGVSYSAINDSDYNSLRLENAASVPAPFLLSGLGLLGLAGARRRSAQ